MRTLFLIWLTVMMAVLTTGCQKVTYPKEKLAESIVTAVSLEYDLQVKAKIVGETLCIWFHVEKLWGEDGFVEKEVWQQIGQIKFVATRLIFSSDAKLEFIRYMITGDDSKEQLDYVRAVLDERLIRYGAIAIDVYQPPSGVISAEEYWAREILIRKDYQKDVEPVFEEVRWGDFLTHQIAKRVKEKYAKILSGNSNLDPIDNFGGSFFAKDDPDNQLGQSLFALIIESKEDPEAIHFLEWVTQQTVEEVCRKYRSFPFERLRIFNVQTDTIFEVTK